jgi:hypothetical protein
MTAFFERGPSMRALFAAVCTAALLSAAPAHAIVGFADVVLDYFDSGAGPIAGPYGGTFPGTFPVPVSTSVVLGNDGSVADFLSLPRGSYVTVGFTDEFVIDGPGNDIFIREVGAGGEDANVFVSSDAVNFVFLGLAQDDGTTSFNLSNIAWTGNVVAVRIVGLDAGGSSPGFDVANIQALPGAAVAVPEPTTWALMILGFGSAGAALRRRRLAT